MKGAGLGGGQGLTGSAGHVQLPSLVMGKSAGGGELRAGAEEPNVWGGVRAAVALMTEQHPPRYPTAGTSTR